ncbi:MAG TPA: thiamine-phosphate kinase [Thermoanaerobaculia bacterium]|nr:thiamine-phosphate kinase [Thermoanaerobaculia bacterium]
MRRGALAGAAGEDALVKWLRRTLGSPARELIGDDAALLRLTGEWALTVDSQIEGTHFLAGLDPAVVAQRLLAVNASDLAAVGAVPVYGLLALSAPAGFDLRRFFRAFAAAAKRYEIALAGGDLARAPLVVASLTLLGRRRGARWLRRDAAKPGDGLWIGGTLGESALGRLLLERGSRWRNGRVELPPTFKFDAATTRVARQAVERHLLPQPQLELSARLVRQRRCACIDVSDGLGRDLARLTAASGVGATVDADALPLPRHAARLTTALGAHPLELALGGGEDYVLLFALPAAAKAPAGSVRIGEIAKRSGLRLRRSDRVETLAAWGWDHLQG